MTLIPMLQEDAETARVNLLTTNKRGNDISPARQLTKQEKLRIDEISLRCLVLCTSMLKRVNGVRRLMRYVLFSLSHFSLFFKNFRENLVLEGVVKDWIIPSIQRVEMVFRQLGLLALGLCCLISKVREFTAILSQRTRSYCSQDMALQSFALFCSQAQNVPESLKPQVLQIIFDILLMHSDVFFRRSLETVSLC